jgi:MOSC domain-containing protein YiiM
MTRDLALLDLPVGTKLRLGEEAIIELTGLRNPCVQIDRFQRGLLGAVLDRDADGRIVRKAGVMSVVVASGNVRPGDTIIAELPPEPHRRLEVV